jgi:RNA polymerase subunit RPABC4/transcription elongation factor Spt4
VPLKPCHECGHQVSTEAASCPQCGARFKEGFLDVMMPRKKDSPVETNWGLRAAVSGAGALLLFALLLWILRG